MPEHEANTVLRSIRFWLKVLVVTTTVCVAGVGVLGYKFFSTAADTKDALCTLRHDLEVRVVQSRRFLDEHPRGVPGISATTLSQSIRNQDRTIDSLANLDCD